MDLVTPGTPPPHLPEGRKVKKKHKKISMCVFSRRTPDTRHLSLENDCFRPPIDSLYILYFFSVNPRHTPLSRKWSMLPDSHTCRFRHPIDYFCEVSRSVCRDSGCTLSTRALFVFGTEPLRTRWRFWGKRNRSGLRDTLIFTMSHPLPLPLPYQKVSSWFSRDFSVCWARATLVYVDLQLAHHS